MAPVSASSPIAIVGLGCVLPDAVGVEAFWQNVLAGRSAIRTLDGGPYDWARYHDATGATPDRAYTRLGARVADFAFDWRRFRMPPAEVELINPMQLMTLEAGAQALADVKNLPAETTGVILGSTGLGWQRDSGLRIRLDDLCAAVESGGAFAKLPAKLRNKVIAGARRALEARLKPVSEDNIVNAAGSVAAGRIAMQFDLRGAHYAVDAGFASSLAAVDVGASLLRDGTLDAVVVGGASEVLTPLELVAFSRLGGLARERVAPFDVDADGTLLGEGVVVFVLKRLHDALSAGDRVFALLRGVGGSTDGRGRALVAPQPDGQALAMRRAYEAAGVEPSTVGFVECHATGTPVGDASEVAALASVFGARGPDGPVALGSAKPFVGHLRAGAGAVAMLRAVLALVNGTVPAQINVRKVNPALGLEATAFAVHDRHVPLGARGGATVARAGVSAFGFGGNNYHAVLEAFAPGSAPRTPARTPPSRATREPIAIVGMGAILPGTDDVATFWQSLLDEHDATREVPADRWAIDRFYDADRDRKDKSYTRIGCFLDALPQPDPAWKIPPAAHATVDPSQLLVLRAAEQAMRDAALDLDRVDRDRVAVMLAFLPYQGKKFLADIRVNYREFECDLERALRDAGVTDEVRGAVLAESERRFKATLPAITEDTLVGYLGSINAARIARHFGFRGPHFVVDSACASTHAAVQAAVQSLRDGVSDVALTGGVWSDMMPEFFIAACRFQALSARGSTPFAEGADGFIPGEGAGVFVLRRLSDAVRDGQRVAAVIRSVAGSSDGRGRSVLAPRPEGEALAMTRALAEAGIAPGAVDYVECHGTGTALGDAVEVDACTRAYGHGRTAPLRIGSVKSNIGHLNAAAGVPGMIKAALALREGMIPASLKAGALNSKIDFAAGPVEVVRHATPWPPRADGAPRRAGVSGFGVGGSNMHLILEEYRPAPAEPRATVGAPRVLPIVVASGSDLRACVAVIERIERETRALDDAGRLDAIARAQAEPPRGEVRVAVVARDAAALTARAALLARVAQQGSDPRVLRAQGVFVGEPRRAGRVALLFPGQGPQYANMARELAAAFPAVRATFDRIDHAYRALCGRALSPAFLLEPGEAYAPPDEDLHCAVFAVSCALAGLLRDYGARVDAVMGQSAGMLAALVAADALTLEDALGAMRQRTLAVLALRGPDPGAMLALGCSADDAQPLISGLRGYCTIAADNSPGACIVAGERATIDALAAKAATVGVEAELLAVSHAYHSRMIAEARGPYLAALRSLRFAPPSCDVVSTVDGASHRGDAADAWREHLASQFVEPVRLRPAVETLYAQGTRLFVECGPKWPLTTFVGQILEGRAHIAQATMHPKVGEVEQFARSIACLFVHGACGLTASRAPVPEAVAPSLPPPSSGSVIASSGPPPEEIMALVTSLRDVIDGFLSKWQLAAKPAVAAPPAPVARVEATARAASEAPAPLAPAPQDPGDSADAVTARLLDAMATRTGYPPDMLGLDLDMEADLGIDTVKQIAILGEVRAHYGLAVEPGFRLRDFNTLRKAAAHLAARVAHGTAATARTTQAPPAERPREEPAPAPNGTPAPAPSGPVAPRADGLDAVTARLLDAMAARTGYPPDMLGLDLDMEADLGIDTVKQIAILGEVRAHYGLAVDPGFRLRDFNTLRKAAAHLAARVLGAPANAPPRVEPVLAPARAAPTRDAVGALLVAKLAERTGYPPDMLGPDLDMEADLGIDTVKQIAVLGEVRAALGLALDPAFKLREHNTIGKAIGYLAQRAAASDAVATPRAAPAQRVDAAPSRPLEVRADDPHAVWLDARSSAPRISVLRCLRGAVDLACRPGVAPAIVALASLRVSGTAPPAAEPSTRLERRASSDGGARVQCQVLAPDGSSYLQLDVLSDPAGHGTEATFVQHEVRLALDRRMRASNGAALRAALPDADGVRTTRVAPVWAFLGESGELVGLARTPSPAGEPTDALVAAVEAALLYAAFGWYDFDGCAHALRRVDAVRLIRAPAAGEELLLHARIGAWSDGEVRADVVVLDGGMRLVARLDGVFAERVGEPSGSVLDVASSPGALAWQRFHRRLCGPLLDGEDQAW